MDKTELQKCINTYKNMISANNSEINELKQKIENIEIEISRRENAIIELNQVFSSQRSSLNEYDLNNKGYAASNFVKANLSLYSVKEENSFVSKENNIINYLHINISKLYEMIDSLEVENNNYSNKVLNYNKEIDKINQDSESNNKTGKKNIL